MRNYITLSDLITRVKEHRAKVVRDIEKLDAEIAYIDMHVYIITTRAQIEQGWLEFCS